MRTESGLYIPREHKATSDRFVREAMETFLDTLEQSDYTAALNRIVQSDFYADPFYEESLQEAVEVFNPTAISYDDGVRATIVTSHVQVLNHPELWNGLLTEAQERDPELPLLLKSAFPLPVSEEEYQRRLAELISSSNSRLFGRSLTLLTAASVFGTALPHVIQDDYKVRAYENDYVSKCELESRYLAAWKLAHDFGAPAVSPKQIVDRMTYLFTPISAVSNDLPAMDVLRSAKAFSNYYKDSTPSVISCPGRDSTLSLLTAYGNLLQLPTYRDYLINDIS